MNAEAEKAYHGSGEDALNALGGHAMLRIEKEKDRFLRIRRRLSVR